jgi:hypothetical protein
MKQEASYQDVLATNAAKILRFWASHCSPCTRGRKRAAEEGAEEGAAEEGAEEGDASEGAASEGAAEEGAGVQRRSRREEHARLVAALERNINMNRNRPFVTGILGLIQALSGLCELVVTCTNAVRVQHIQHQNERRKWTDRTGQRARSMDAANHRLKDCLVSEKANLLIAEAVWFAVRIMRAVGSTLSIEASPVCAMTESQTALARVIADVMKLNVSNTLTGHTSQQQAQAGAGAFQRIRDLVHETVQFVVDRSESDECEDHIDLADVKPLIQKAIRRTASFPALKHKKPRTVLEYALTLLFGDLTVAADQKKAKFTSERGRFRQALDEARQCTVKQQPQQPLDVKVKCARCDMRRKIVEGRKEFAVGEYPKPTTPLDLIDVLNEAEITTLLKTIEGNYVNLPVEGQVHEWFKRDINLTYKTKPEQVITGLDTHLSVASEVYLWMRAVKAAPTSVICFCKNQCRNGCDKWEKRWNGEIGLWYGSRFNGRPVLSSLRSIEEINARVPSNTADPNVQLVRDFLVKWYVIEPEPPAAVPMKDDDGDDGDDGDDDSKKPKQAKASKASKKSKKSKGGSSSDSTDSSDSSSGASSPSKKEIREEKRKKEDAEKATKKTAKEEKKKGKEAALQAARDKKKEKREEKAKKEEQTKKDAATARAKEKSDKDAARAKEQADKDAAKARERAAEIAAAKKKFEEDLKKKSDDEAELVEDLWNDAKRTAPARDSESELAARVKRNAESQLAERVKRIDKLMTMILHAQTKLHEEAASGTPVPYTTSYQSAISDVIALGTKLGANLADRICAPMSTYLTTRADYTTLSAVLGSALKAHLVNLTLADLKKRLNMASRYNGGKPATQAPVGAPIDRRLKYAADNEDKSEEDLGKEAIQLAFAAAFHKCSRPTHTYDLDPKLMWIVAQRRREPNGNDVIEKMAYELTQLHPRQGLPGALKAFADASDFNRITESAFAFALRKGGDAPRKLIDQRVSTPVMFSMLDQETRDNMDAACLAWFTGFASTTPSTSGAGVFPKSLWVIAQKGDERFPNEINQSRGNAISERNKLRAKAAFLFYTREDTRPLLQVFGREDIHKKALWYAAHPRHLREVGEDPTLAQAEIDTINRNFAKYNSAMQASNEAEAALNATAKAKADAALKATANDDAQRAAEDEKEANDQAFLDRARLNPKTMTPSDHAKKAFIEEGRARKAAQKAQKDKADAEKQRQEAAQKANAEKQKAQEAATSANGGPLAKTKGDMVEEPFGDDDSDEGKSEKDWLDDVGSFDGSDDLDSVRGLLDLPVMSTKPTNKTPDPQGDRPDGLLSTPAPVSQTPSHSGAGPRPPFPFVDIPIADSDGRRPDTDAFTFQTDDSFDVNRALAENAYQGRIEAARAKLEETERASAEADERARLGTERASAEAAITDEAAFNSSFADFFGPGSAFGRPRAARGCARLSLYTETD